MCDCHDRHGDFAVRGQQAGPLVEWIRLRRTGVNLSHPVPAHDEVSGALELTQRRHDVADAVVRAIELRQSRVVVGGLTGCVAGP